MLRVRRDLLAAIAPHYPRSRPVTPEMILDLCGCGHEGGAHHGPDGRAHCGEHGCGCLAWYPCQVECPDCSAEWPELALDCRCGLTIETLAERCAG